MGTVTVQVAPREILGVVAVTAEQSIVLPEGMKLDCAMRIDLAITAETETAGVSLRLALEGNLRGSGDPGEWLESIQFVKGETILSLGGPDREWMTSFERRSAYDVTYEPSALLISFGALSRGETVRCPLALAYVSGHFGPENDHWTWYGVGAVLTS